jgi:membrane-associated phospholipid phosphatase
LKTDSLIGKTDRSKMTHRGLPFICLFGIVVPLCVFVWLTEAIRHQRNLPWDAAILKFLHSSATPWRDNVMARVAQSGRIEVVVVFAVLGVLVLKHDRRMRDAFFLTLAIVGVVIANMLVRTVVQRHQSDLWGTFAPTFDFGFPSSQAADTLAVALVLAILAWPTRWRWPIIAPGIFYVVAVGVSRISLGLHYPSDILAGWALALAWVTAVSFVRRIPGVESTKLKTDA